MKYTPFLLNFALLHDIRPGAGSSLEDLCMNLFRPDKDCSAVAPVDLRRIHTMEIVATAEAVSYPGIGRSAERYI